MIGSYATELGRSLFQGNWAVFAGPQALEPLEDCFIDLRILDAAATLGDVQRAFRGRLTSAGSSDSARSYSIREPDKCKAKYSIEFVWMGTSAEAVNVKLSPPGEA